MLTSIRLTEIMASCVFFVNIIWTPFIFLQESRGNLKFVAITNNVAFKEKYENQFEVSYHDVTLRELFVIVRDKVHLGYGLLTHPMSGSVKPNETPFKTVFISNDNNKISTNSLALIEGAIMTCDKFAGRNIDYSDKIEDFQLVDMSLAESALPGLLSF